MKKLILLLFFAVFIIAGGIIWYVENYSNRSYYVQIDSNGIIEKDNLKGDFLLGFYKYQIKGFDSEGSEKKLDFTANHNLRLKAYLKVRENGKRGVISWEEINRENIPKKALDNLDKQSMQLVPPN